MFGQLKENWKHLKSGAPGRRFQVCYDHQSTQTVRRARWLAIATGVPLMLAGLLLVPTPIAPGWAIFFLGLALLASAWRPAARLLDWAELRLRLLIRRAADLWRRLSPSARIGLVTLATFLVASLSYLAVTLVLPD